MTRKEAAKILGVNRQDDTKIIKQKFRKLIGKYHPDAVGADKPEHILRAQQIIEAYSILREQTIHDEDIPVPTATWKANIVEHAFTERIIYMILWEDRTKEYIEVAKGRYEWDPDLEDFDCLLKSLNQAVMDLLEEIEHKYGIYHDNQYDIKEQRFLYQVQLFHMLAGQYILPVSCLKKLVKPIKRDEQKRNIYQFQAFLGTKGDSKAFRAMLELKSGDLLYADSLQNNRIMISDGKGIALGHLSLAEDSLYYVIIPLVQKRLAQVKFLVKAIEVKRSVRPYTVRIHIDLLLRMETMEEVEMVSDQNLKIAETLNKYDAYLKDIVSD